MNNHDDLMDVIRRARPDDQASARTPAAQALLEEILSMDVETREAEAADTASAPTVTAIDSRRPRRRYVLVGGIAAAVLAAVAVVGGITGGPGGPDRADAIEAALSRSASALADSGRAEVTFRHEWDNGDVETSTDSWEYSGDDSSVTVDYRIDGVPSGCVDMDGEPVTPCDAVQPINRYVDGEIYLYGYFGEDPTVRWYHAVATDGSLDGLDGFEFNPATLLAELDPAGGFEDVGREQVDGVETTRKRAVDPAGTPIPDVVGFAGDTVTSLEVWVDDEGLVRRLDLATTDEHPAPGDAVLDAATLSVVFSDLGEPITIEAPTEFEELPL